MNDVHDTTTTFSAAKTQELAFGEVISIVEMNVIQNESYQTNYSLTTSVMNLKSTRGMLATDQGGEEQAF